MQISIDHQGHFVEMRIAGRLDNEWSSRLTEAIDAAVRDGSHTIVLDLTDVGYISSAGIGVLVRAHKQFQEIHGFFGVGQSSDVVQEIIRSTGLAKMLLCDVDKIRRSLVANPATIQPMMSVVAKWGTTFDVYDLEEDATQVCQVYGDASRLPRQAYQAADCRIVEFPRNSLGFGLGALGRDFSECEHRFGEFLSVAGSVAQLPTSSADKPDYQLSQGDFVPQVQVAYGMRCTGGFRQLCRFDSLDADCRIPLSGLMDECLKIARTDLASVVLVGESAGLVGASLRRSPATSSIEHSGKFEHPEIRNWLSYSPDRVFPHTVALVVGIATRRDQGPLRPLLRPLNRPGSMFGHFHAAVFSYRPFKKRKLDLESTVGALFDTEELQSVLHLLYDDRENEPQESQFVRGACWIAPISQVTGGNAT